MLNETKGEICDNDITISVSKTHNSGVKIKSFSAVLHTEKEKAEKTWRNSGKRGERGERGERGGHREGSRDCIFQPAWFSQLRCESTPPDSSVLISVKPSHLCFNWIMQVIMLH